MNDLKSAQNRIAAFLELNEQDLRDFHESSDHDKKCKCDKCKKWYLIMKGKYKS